MVSSLVGLLLGALRQYEIIVLFTRLTFLFELIAKIYTGEKQAHAM